MVRHLTRYHLGHGMEMSAVAHHHLPQTQMMTWPAPNPKDVYAMSNMYSQMQLPHLAKLLYTVWPKRDEPWAARARLHALYRVVRRWIAPQKVHEHRPPVLHCHRPWDGLDLVNLCVWGRVEDDLEEEPCCVCA